MRSYLTVWRLPSAPVILLAGFAGRLPSSMVPLALLLMVQDRTGSYALDATATEAVFVAGPTAVALLALTTSPSVALAVAGLLGVSGAVGVACSGPMRAWRPVTAAPRPVTATVRAPGMPRVLVSGSALMLGVGALEVAVPAFADAAGRPGIAGLLLAVWALGSVGGGLWFGARVVSASLPRQYRWGLLGVTVGLAPLAAVSSPWVLGALLFLGGTAIAPTLTVQSSLVGSITPAAAATEAFTWLSTVAFGASAVGAAVGGALVESPAGVTGALVTATAAAALAVAVTLVPGRRPARAAGRGRHLVPA